MKNEYMNEPVRPTFPCSMISCRAFVKHGSRWNNGVPNVPCIVCCDVCRDLDSRAITCAHNDIALKIAMHNLNSHTAQYHYGRGKPREGNGKYLGKWAFTLTCSPDDKLSMDEMVIACRKIMAQKSCPVKYFAWYVEYRDVEQLTGYHIHGIYETESGGRIEAKHFMRAWRIWDEKVALGKGFRGGYHRPVRSEEGYKDYIKKDEDKHDSPRDQRIPE